MRDGTCQHCGHFIRGDDDTAHRVWVAVTHDNCFLGVYASRAAARRACSRPGESASEEEVLDG